MVGERVKAIPGNIKSDFNDFRHGGVVAGVKGTSRRFMNENKGTYYRTKNLVQRGVNKVKSTARKVVHR